MIQRRYGMCFALETLAELGFGNFDRHDAIQARVVGLVHLSHAARADWRKDFVGAEFVACGERHTGLIRFERSRSEGDQVLN